MLNVVRSPFIIFCNLFPIDISFLKILLKRFQFLQNVFKFFPFEIKLKKHAISNDYSATNQT